jgi:NitT/TauT family transport system permease protein
MIRKPIARRWQIGLGIAAFVLLAGFYTVLSYRQHARNPDDTTIPTWGLLAERLVQIVSPHERTGEVWLWLDARRTLWRLLSGLALAVLLGVPLGLAMGCYPPVAAFGLPPLAFLAKVPPTAMLAVFFVMVGTGYEMYVAMIVFGVLPSLAQTVCYAAAEDVPDELIFKAYTLGASQLETIWEVIYQHILPKTLDAIRLQIGPAMVYLIAAEMLLADVGLGFRIRIQARLMDMSTVYLYLVFLGLVGLLMDFGLGWFRRWMCPWYGH